MTLIETIAALRPSVTLYRANVLEGAVYSVTLNITRVSQGDMHFDNGNSLSYMYLNGYRITKAQALDEALAKLDVEIHSAGKTYNDLKAKQKKLKDLEYGLKHGT